MRSVALIIVLTLALPAFAQSAATFEGLPYHPDTPTYENGANLAGSFISGGATFANSYNALYDSWSGFAYSNATNVTTPGYGNQYAAYHLPTGGTGDNSPNYAVSYIGFPNDVAIHLPGGHRPDSLRITNTTYTALSMRDGDSFAKKFGGPTGSDPDYLQLTIRGHDSFDASGAINGSIAFYLADYRFANNEFDYIINHWTTVDLASLPESTRSLSFSLESTDNGQYGMNTPSYFALDNLVMSVAVPEPAGLVAVAGLCLILARRGRCL